MFIGGYVSSAGLGLTCPEWPLCPNGIMPNEQYFIEWTHRLIAVTTGSLVIATASNPLKPGQEGSVTFTAGAPGTYYYICTVPGHALQGMQGSFIVE